MGHDTSSFVSLPPEQEAIRAKCFHPSRSFVEFTADGIEQSIPGRFERIVAEHPQRPAVQTGSRILTYAELNATANGVAHFFELGGHSLLATRVISRHYRWTCPAQFVRRPDGGRLGRADRDGSLAAKR
jgi:non-ribosomal peptide synthetase component F